MNTDTTNCAFGRVAAGTTSRQGTTPMIDRLIARYRAATATVAITIDRGMTRPGSLTSSPM
jgi:hypothetical protein